MRLIPVLAASLFIACDNESKAELGDIPEDSGEVVNEDCEVTIADTNPNDGKMGWFYREAVTLTFSESNPDISLTLSDSAGNDEAVSFTWDDSRMNATVLPDDGAWTPGETHSLGISLCGNTPSISFGVSEFGMDLEVEESALIGNTYFIDLSTATYIEPPGVGSLLGLFLDMPLLLGVSSIDGGIIDFEAGLGTLEGSSSEWSTVGDHWLFDGADFSNSPYFSAQTELLDIPYGDVVIPVHDFAISGTFAADASSIGFATFTGLGDTSTMGPLMNLGSDPEVLCTEVLQTYGIDCIACPGDSPLDTCIQLTGEIEQADLIPGVNILD